MSYSDSQFSKEDFGLGVDGGKAAVYWVAGARTPHVCDLSGYTCLFFFAETSSSDWFQKAGCAA